MARFPCLRRLLGTSLRRPIYRSTARLVLELLEERTLPTINLTGVPVNIPEQSLFNNGPVATFTDTITTDLAADFIASVNWGDGTTAASASISGGNGNFTITSTHTYSDERTANVVVVLDQVSSSSSFTVTTQATVAEADTLLAGTMTVTAAEGQQFSGTVATFTDTLPSGPNDFQATIDWGDGTTDAGTTTGEGGGIDVSGSHTYADEGKFQITVVLTDDAPGTASATATSQATVGEADILGGTGVTISPTQFSSFSGAVATFSNMYPANSASDFSATVDWGDNVTTAGTVSSNLGVLTVAGTHTYAGAGPFTILVTLTDVDDDGSGQANATGTATSTANVAQAPFTVKPATIAPSEGALFNGIVATIMSTDPTSKPGQFAATIDWGDGTMTGGMISGATGGPFTVIGSHTYAEEGPYTETIDVQQVEGPLVGATAPVKVSDPAVIWTGVSTYRTQEALDFGGQPLATFTDPGGAETVGNYTATVDWGDGATTAGTVVAQGSSFVVNGQHTYAEPGTYAVHVTAHHDQAADTTIVTDALAVDAPVLVNTVSGPRALAVGQYFIGLMGTFVDDNPTATTSDFIVGLYWGDGAFNLGSVVPLGTDATGKTLFGVYGYHAYSTAGKPAFTLAVYDIDGANCIVYSPTVLVYKETQFLDLWAVNAEIVQAQVMYQIYSSEFAHDHLAFEQSLANYWIAVYLEDIGTYHHVAETGML